MPNEELPRWEYLTRDVPDEIAHRVLNERGKYGWALVAATLIEGRHEVFWKVIFMRPVYPPTVLPALPAGLEAIKREAAEREYQKVEATTDRQRLWESLRRHVLDELPREFTGLLYLPAGAPVTFPGEPTTGVVWDFELQFAGHAPIRVQYEMQEDGTWTKCAFEEGPAGPLVWDVGEGGIYATTLGDALLCAERYNRQ